MAVRKGDVWTCKGCNKEMSKIFWRSDKGLCSICYSVSIHGTDEAKRDIGIIDLNNSAYCPECKGLLSVIHMRDDKEMCPTCLEFKYKGDHLECPMCKGMFSDLLFDSKKGLKICSKCFSNERSKKMEMSLSKWM